MEVGNKSSKQAKTSESKGQMNGRKQKNGGYQNDKGKAPQYVAKASSQRDAGSDQYLKKDQN